MSKTASIGVDIGGTKTRLSLFGGKMNVVDTIKFKTPKKRDEFESQMTASARKLIEKAKDAGFTISAAGVGAAGSVDESKRVITSAPNVPFLSGFSINKALEPLCRCEVALLNDVHAALYGELKAGNAVGCKHVIAVFIGTAINGALAIDGKLYRGASGEAGNIGHYLLNPFGPLAGSERHGILDDFASRISIAGTAATFAAKSWAPHLRKSAGTDVRNITSEELAKAIRAGDTSIEELVRSRVQIVGIVLSNIVDFISPQMIVVGGGLTDAMPAIVRRELTVGIRAHSMASARRELKIVTAKHKEHAVAIGAARFALDAKGNPELNLM